MLSKVNRFFVVTALVAINVLCVIIAMTVTEWLGTATINAVDMLVVQITLILILVVGVVFMVITIFGKST